MKADSASSAAVALLLACSAAPVSAPRVIPGSSEPPAPSDVERYLPLRDGDVLSYLVWQGDAPQPEQVIYQVERRSPREASLRAGNQLRRLALDPSSVQLVTGGTLLAAPLELGAEWAGAAGRVRVTAIERSVDVPAGHFEGCLVTTEQNGPSPASIVTTYCPDVGIATIEVDGGEHHERFELRSFGPRVDIDAM
jgi:hypothetical protein